MRHRAPRAGTWALASLAAVALAGCGSFDGDGDFAACAIHADGGNVVVGSGVPGDPTLPEPSSGYRPDRPLVTSKRYMVVTANPHASRAGCEVLRDGGSAADAAVAVQAVLGLVEPQSSGLGGGTFVMHYDKASGRVQAYDGRETAPAMATGEYLRRISDADARTPQPDARRSGRAIGTPGTVKVLAQLHADHGARPWAPLFDHARTLATDGFAISGRMADAIAGARDRFLQDDDAVAYFLNPDLTPRALGTLQKNPAYADTLQRIATGGADAFYTGEIAADVAAEIGRTTGGAAAPIELTPGQVTLADLSSYQAKVRDSVCIAYRRWDVCGMPPPSSGGIAVAQTLGILENFDLAAHAPTAIDRNGGKPTVMGVHLVSEAERLAYADRNRYVADADFVPLPGAGVASMLDKAYLAQRAARIRLDASLGTAPAGDFTGAVPMGSSAQEGRGTTHASIVDRQGNAVSMTTTIESGMGSYRFVRGFLLNNQLTDFSAAPVDDAGLPIANRVEGGKRPRSSMAPTLVFDRNADGSRGALAMVTGSPGGSTIIQFVVKTLVGVLDWNLDAQQATSLANFGSANGPVTGIGGEHPAIAAADNGNGEPLVTGLRALGHTVNVAAQSSGVSTIVRTADTAAPLQGGADPRREGLVLGD